MTIRSFCEEYLDAGLSLTLVSGKTPLGTGWNKPENTICHVDQLPKKIEGIGLCHAYCEPPTMSVDIDDLVKARDWFKQRDVDLTSLLDAPDAVRIESGRPNKTKLFYRLPSGVAPLTTRMLRDGAQNILEFRCATKTGLTVQDVLPPSIHPITGEPYRWAGGGSFTRIPTLPTSLLNVWLGELSQGVAVREKSDDACLNGIAQGVDADTEAVGGYPESPENIRPYKRL
jgi:hypothetical protein